MVWRTSSTGDRFNCTLSGLDQRVTCPDCLALGPWDGVPAHVEYLRRHGVLGEVQAMWDAEDRGEDPYGPVIDDVVELERRVKRASRRAFWRGLARTFSPFGR